MGIEIYIQDTDSFRNSKQHSEVQT